MTSTIVIVDDEPALRTVVAQVLREDGYVVFEAEDGRAALVVLAERAIDLIITDLTMPGLDGNGLIAELTGRPNPPPIIVMSAMRLQTLDEDIAASLQKPFDLEMLILVVERVLSEAALA